MIEFVCRHCGTQHRRPDDAAGSLFFCDCGQSTRIPWDIVDAVPDPDAASAGQEETPRQRPLRQKRHAGECLDHPGTLAQGSCQECHEPFCDRCLVKLQEKTLCGPCKDFKVRQLQKIPPFASLTLAGFLVILVGTPFMFCAPVILIGQGASDGIRLVVFSVVMIFPIVALSLSLASLKQVEGNVPRRGRTLALTGAVCAAAGLMWLASLVLHLTWQMVRN